MNPVHLSIILTLCIILSSTMLLQHANASDGKKPSVENIGFTAFSFLHRDDFSPLKQFKAGVPTYGIACNDLKLVIKKSDNTPVCVKPQNVQSLLVRGWGTLLSPYDHQTSNASSILKLDLSVTNDTIKSGQSITMEISLVNTLSKKITIPEANDWPNNYLAISECSPFYPVGISILKGDYTKQNMTGITPLSLYPGYGCSTNPSLIPSYTFQPLSSKTTPICEFTVACPQLMIMKSQLSYDGYYDNNQSHPFDTGRYTIVGGDEWGHIAIRHFVIVNNTQGDLEQNKSDTKVSSLSTSRSDLGKIISKTSKDGVTTIRSQNLCVPLRHAVTDGITDETTINMLHIGFPTSGQMSLDGIVSLSSSKKTTLTPISSGNLVANYNLEKNSTIVNCGISYCKGDNCNPDKELPTINVSIFVNDTKGYCPPTNLHLGMACRGPFASTDASISTNSPSMESNVPYLYKFYLVDSLGKYEEWFFALEYHPQ